MPDPQWLIDGYILDGSLAMIHAAPNVGKSFVALDWCLSVAKGLPWFGHKTLEGNTLYVAGEGLGGLKARVGVWQQHHGIARLERAFYALGPVPLNDPTSVQAVITHTQQHTPTKLIVFDTLSRCIPGMDENDQKDMSQMIATVDAIRLATGSAVLLVHHSTKSVENPSARGSSVINGACDTVMELQPKGQHFKLVCQKQKEADYFRPIDLKLVEIRLPNGTTSCYVNRVI